MHLRQFLKSGHSPTLVCAFLYFDVSFMVWVIVGALGNAIAADLQLSDAQKGLLVAVPLLGGALLRLPLGMLADYWGGRRAGLAGLALTVVPLVLGWQWSASYWQLLLIGLLLGIAGASFAVALPLAGRWYPTEFQGLAMGIAGAGNSGTALATLLAPRLAEWFGWQRVFALAILPVLAVLVIFWLAAKDSPKQPPPKRLREYLAVLRVADTWWLCAYYCITFGGFVGLASFLSIYFNDQFQLGQVSAGSFAALCVVTGSLVRPVGGFLADRFGGARVMPWLFALLAALMLLVAMSPTLAVATTLLFISLGTMGLANGAVFQIVPTRFPGEVGVVTGIVGAAGGLGGFVLPSILGAAKQWTGGYASGFALFAAAALAAGISLAIRRQSVAAAAAPHTATVSPDYSVRRELRRL